MVSVELVSGSLVSIAFKARDIFYIRGCPRKAFRTSELGRQKSSQLLDLPETSPTPTGKSSYVSAEGKPRTNVFLNVEVIGTSHDCISLFDHVTNSKEVFLNKFSTANVRRQVNAFSAGRRLRRFIGF